MVLTVSFALSPVIGLTCHRRRRDVFRRLDAGIEASGPHDFAVRFRHAFVFRTQSVHRIPRPTSVTIAKRPSVEGHGTAGLMDLIWVKGEGIYFQRKDWTGSISLIGFDKFAVWRKGALHEIAKNRHLARLLRAHGNSVNHAVSFAGRTQGCRRCVRDSGVGVLAQAGNTYGAHHFAVHAYRHAAAQRHDVGGDECRSAVIDVVLDLGRRPL
jgi:hypothetical protein